MTRLADEEALRQDADNVVAQLTKENDALSHWKVVYENGHGLQELAKHQKRMKEDQRRLGMTLENMSVQLSETVEAKALVEQAFQKLKEEAGRDPDFEYPELELKQEMKSENGKLRLQVSEMEEQIDHLEADCIRLRKALKNQIGAVGEEGFKYAGMSPDMILKVNEFAASLRDGKIELPLDDRSKELLDENRDLRHECKVLKLTVERYENELRGGTSGELQQQLAEVMASSAGNKRAEQEIFGLREDVHNLLRVNDGLQHNLAHMQNEITMLLKQQIGKTDGTTDGITAMLLASNESLMKELQEIRYSAGGSVSGVRDTEPSQDDKSPRSADESSHGGNSTGGGRNVFKGSRPPTGGKKTAPTSEGAPPHSTPRRPPTGQAAHTPPGDHTSDFNNLTALFTPGGNFQPQMTSRTGYASGVYGQGLQTPATPHGKTLLTRTLANMNLPPEEWADELKELNGQLIECLEQLYEKEEELQQQKVVIDNLEDYLVEVKQQMAAMYFEYAQRANEWEEREKAMKKETSSLISERDDLSLKLKRAEETVDLLDREDKGDEATTMRRLEEKIKEYSRKVTVYEVNEAVLSRKFLAMSEQMTEEQTIRKRLESDFVEMEGVLKRRVLFLEQYKSMAGPKLTRLQSELDNCVPQSDYIAVQNELEGLREDHLYALRRELEARVSALNAQEKAREVRSLKEKVVNLEADLVMAKQGWHNAQAELENQKDVTQRAVSSCNSDGIANKSGPVQSSSNREIGALVSEMAKYRGDASRLEVELVSANHRCDLLEVRLRECNNEVDAALSRIKELEERNESAETSERTARKECMDIKMKYEGGLTGEEAEKMKLESLAYQRKIADLESSVTHLKEMAEIATMQAQTLSDYRDTYQDELKMLREHAVVQESRTDDDLIIGRLQRQLMATKTAYKAFTRKYQVLRGNMRQREITQRILEHRLDQREEAALKIQESHRLEILALKKALKSVYECMIAGSDSEFRKSNTVSDSAVVSKSTCSVQNIHHTVKSMLQRVTGVGNTARGQVTLSEKLCGMSQQIGSLSALAENAGERAEAAEKKCTSLEGECERLKEDNAILRRTIRDMNDVLEAGGMGVGSGGNAVASKKQIHANSKAIAARVLGLSEEVRALKLASLQQKREVSVLQQDKKHLKGVLARVEDDLRSLEENRLMLDAQPAIVGAGCFGTEDPLIKDFLQLRDDLFGYDDEDNGSVGTTLKDSAATVEDVTTPDRSPHDKPLKTSPQKLLVNTDVDIDDSERGISKQELLDKLQQTTSDVISHKRDVDGYKRQVENMHGKVLELQALLDERDEQLAYYERMAVAEGLPTVKGTMGSGIQKSTAPRGREWRMMREEQEKLQEAASATIGSMRSLLEEKNREIERYRSKIDALQSNSITGGVVGRRGMSVADRRAEELLRRLEEEDRYKSGVRRGVDESEAIEKTLVQRLMDQIDHADEILQEKIKTINQLEQKVALLNNQREKAEHRCGAALEEMEAMKVDMVTLVKQLKENDEKYNQLLQYNKAVNVEVSGGVSTGVAAPDTDVLPLAKLRELKRKNLELQKSVSMKDEKVKQYRSIIVNLKEEFIKSEEERALSEMGAKSSATAPRNDMDSAEMDQLRSQVSALRDGLRQAKEDLDTARKGREKLLKARQTAQEENERLESQMARAEAQASAAQEALHRCRRDLEESKKREVRLREKVKDLTGRGEGGEREVSTNLQAQATERLQREVELLRSENNALRRAMVGGGGEVSKAVVDRSQSEYEEHDRSPRQPSGRIVSGTPPGGIEEMRQQLHSKWEAEKRLQKRISTLEKRLQEKIEECDDAQAQLRRQKELTLQNQTAMQREKDRADRATKSAKNSRQQGGDILKNEELHGKLFELESENDALRRKAIVQLPNELSAMRHQVDVLTNRVNELERELDDSEARRKQMAAATKEGGAFTTALRASEDRYLREEMLKDELTAARKIRQELEATLLERDSQALELRFDVESKEGEIVRLRRRVKELEAICKHSSGGTDPDMSSAPRPAGSRFNKDRDSEAVVESLRKVVDRLKAENDRLRRGIGTGEGKASDAEKKLLSERKKTEKLEDEVSSLQQKVKTLEDGGQKLAQRQQQVASLRKQLKSKDDALSEQLSKVGTLEEENALLKKSCTDASAKIQQLEMQVASRALGRGAWEKKPTSDATVEVAELRRKSAQQALEVETLKAQLMEARREIVAARNSSRTDALGGGSNAGEVAKLKDQINKLSTENSRLKHELSAFDLDFFEEIENLKYSHAEATRKLRAMEKKFGPVR